MTRAEFGRCAEKLFGENWRTRTAAELGVERTQVWRWRTGRSPIPRAVELAVRAMVANETARRAMRS